MKDTGIFIVLGAIVAFFLMQKQAVKETTQAVTNPNGNDLLNNVLGNDAIWSGVGDLFGNLFGNEDTTDSSGYISGDGWINFGE